MLGYPFDEQIGAAVQWPRCILGASEFGPEVIVDTSIQRLSQSRSRGAGKQDGHHRRCAQIAY